MKSLNEYTKKELIEFIGPYMKTEMGKNPAILNKMNKDEIKKIIRGEELWDMDEKWPGNEGGMPTKKKKKADVTIMVAVGKPKKTLKGGGMAYGKKHNYFAGGSVKDNRRK